MDSFMFYPPARPVKTPKLFITKWDVEIRNKHLNKRAIARIRHDKFYDFDNITDTHDEDAVNRLANWEIKHRIKEQQFKRLAHKTLMDKFVQLYINQTKDFEWLD